MSIVKRMRMWNLLLIGMLALCVTLSSPRLAMAAGATVVAWGSNDYGQTNVPAGLSNVIAIASGGNNHMALVGK